AHPRPLDRQVHRAPGRGARRPQEPTGERGMTNDTLTTVQVHRIFINASAQAVWDAITAPGWSERYGYGGSTPYDLRPGGAYPVQASPAILPVAAPETGVAG